MATLLLRVRNALHKGTPGHASSPSTRHTSQLWGQSARGVERTRGKKAFHLGREMIPAAGSNTEDDVEEASDASELAMLPRSGNA